MPELAELQAALQAAIITPSAEGWERAGGLLAESRLTAQRRLSLYARGYRARLLDTLKGEFPSLHALVGEEVFGLFATGYLEAHPPTGPSLHDLGARFPDWLAAGRPEGTAEGDLAALPASLARLERAWSEALRAEGPERDPAPHDLMGDPTLRLRLPASTTLLRLDFDFAPLLAAVADREPPPAPEARPTRVAVARGGYRVRLHTLGAARFAWLEALGQDGAPAHLAAARAAEVRGIPAGALLADLALWLPLAAQHGLVMADRT